MDHAEKISGSVKHSHVKDVLAQELIEVAGYGRSKTVRVDVDGGFAEVLVEMIHPPQPLVIFGAGYDAIPLARMAAELGFHVTIVDSRPAYADPKRFPEADAIVVAAPESIADRVVLTDRSAAVIMSHNYLSDLAVFRALLPVKLRYLGLMGPRKRAEKMLGELRDEKFPVTDSVLERIHNPIGLDIGADTPEQIALAILAEIQCVSAQRGGGLLRDKKGPIHA
jgi:xanthine/CO dehydrogenase XdhC/CoxF family maturation factor